MKAMRAMIPIQNHKKAIDKPAPQIAHYGKCWIVFTVGKRRYEYLADHPDHVFRAKRIHPFSAWRALEYAKKHFRLVRVETDETTNPRKEGRAKIIRVTGVMPVVGSPWDGVLDQFKLGNDSVYKCGKIITYTIS